MRKFTVIIVDDESPARELIKNFIKSYDEFEVIEEAANGFDGCLKINQHKPDLVFLDVQMPKLSGVEVLDLLEKPLPFIIFSTAYDQYAVQAFEKNALDYLLKPYNKDRFNKAINKFIEKFKDNASNPDQNDQLLEGIKPKNEKINRIPVRSGSKIHVLKLEEVKFIEAQDDYIKIHSTKGAFLKQQTMKHMEQNLPDDVFIRIHRSYILNINFLNQLEIYDRHGYTAVTSDNNKLPVSRQGAGKLKKAIQMD
jgi:two-component system LytT family response regulator